MAVYSVTFANIVGYAKRHRLQVLLMGAMLLLTYYYRLITTSVSMDSTIAVEDAEYVYRWQAVLGRNGLLLFNWLFGTVQLIPGYAGALLIVATFAYGVIWMALLSKVRGDNAPASFDWVFPVLYFSSIPMLEVVCYQHQGFQIAVGVGLIGYALHLWWDQAEDFSVPKFALAALLCGLAFSTYQSLVTFTISAIIGTCLLYCASQGKSFKEAVTIALKSMLLVALSYVVFKLVNVVGTMLVAPQSDSSYLTGQFMWGKASVADIVGGLVSHMKEACLGRGMYCKWYPLGAALLFLVTLGWSFDLSRAKGYGWYLVLVYVLLALSPFFINVASGSSSVAIRAELSFACTYALMASLALSGIEQRLLAHVNVQQLVPTVLAVMCAGVAVLVIKTSVSPANRLLYTDYRVLQEQYLLTVDLYNQYERIDAGRGLSPVFVGQWHPHYDASMQCGEMLGSSLYEWGNRAPTEYWQALGYNVVRATDEQLERAYELAEDMPRMPQEGFIQEREGMVVIALPDPTKPF